MIWFVSDTHFQHENILKFKDNNGNHMRPNFSSTEEMDETMISRWNERVKPGHRVYHLGDVLFGDRSNLAKIVSRLNGSKRLIVGNHDDIIHIAKSDVFQKIYMWRSFRDHGFVCTHVPMLMGNAKELGLDKALINVHGHIHEKPDPSERHMNISVERTNYYPIHLDEIKAEIARRDSTIEGF